ncbi:hypothetical protein HYH03_003177 [Edaphochlamys debaryana]|uniref:Peptidase M16 C-terminal domain-containing protein n=1 Tax=Edaphochlamys debaryana TaxID=47281 RepID=A0A835YAE8_9CHLO|nr:hypothetical protein HYH03_003177 [Edaphochlamys debaryana]|eukprot:KAG2498991.1 hypothetical protein HYH03_003177 [Edaphochlamys debaryana]
MHDTAAPMRSRGSGLRGPGPPFGRRRVGPPSASHHAPGVPRPMPATTPLDDGAPSTPSRTRGLPALAPALSTLATAGKAALATALSAAVLLAPPLGTLPSQAAAAGALAAPPSSLLSPAEARTATGPAHGAPGSTAAAPAPSVRFTGPEALSTLPPLPTEFPPLPQLTLPKYTQTTLRNGLRVFLLRDDEVPLVRASLLMRGGQYASLPDKLGLASLTTYVQRAGGSTQHPAAVLDSRLEELAAGVEVSSSALAISADMSCLAEDAEEVLGLMAEVVRSPALPSDTLNLYRAQILNALEHQNDSPGAIARRKMNKLLYGPDSVYARTPTPESVNAITREDLRAYVERWERPDAAVLGVVGAFEPKAMLAVIEKEFGDWAPAPGQPPQPPTVPSSPPPALPPLVEAAAAAAEARAEAEAAGAAGAGPGSAAVVAVGGRGVAAAGVAAAEGAGGEAVAAAAVPRRPVVYLVHRPGLTQASVTTAEPGIKLSDPDLFALDVLGSAFNSFGGSLFNTLRSREGLAYSVSGSWDSPPDHQGLFEAGGQTSSPGEFLRSLRSLLASAAADPPSEAELEAAKAETLNSFAFNFSSTPYQLQRILVYDLLGLPQDFLFRYFRGIEAVTRADVARAAAAHLHPRRQAVVVVGDRDSAVPSLEAAGFAVVELRLEDDA